MTVILVACAAFVATYIGGSFAIRFRDKLHLILGFSAGAVVGVALFDLLPESMALSAPYFAPRMLTLALAAGFLFYLLLDRLILLHTHDEDDEAGAGNVHRGFLGAATLSIHSFLDGVAIGVGFQASLAVGIVITAAVLTHDFSDGINTVNVVLKNGGARARAFRWLFVDALAPVMGAASTLLFAIPERWLGIVLAVFAGFFLYLSASDLIPESHHRHPRVATTLMTILGAAVLYAVVALTG
ncbi:MAG: ZIP family metal transporter [Patescibacteria group bacterium]|nr:ZIP family metal transporter [Patescibacteria group bacterium]MDE1965785.1 ZIP family metal transporter [Patescibacteria group bacterium]